MKFAKVTFWIAGVWGVLIMTPLYFMYDLIGRQDPPPLTRPQFYFAFVGVTLAFQIVFFVIASDPARFRPMIVASLFEKLSYIIAVAVLYLEGRTKVSETVSAYPDAILSTLFLISWFKTKPVSAAQAVRRERDAR